MKNINNVSIPVKALSDLEGSQSPVLLAGDIFTTVKAALLRNFRRRAWADLAREALPVRKYIHTNECKRSSGR